MRKKQYKEHDKLKGVLITRTAIKTLVAEDVVEKVIMFQFKDVKEATHTHEQIEISGFGKFMTSKAKIKRKQEKLELVLEAMKKKFEERPHEIPTFRLAMWDKMVDDTTNMLEFIKAKKGGYENKYKGDTGGDMELHIRKEGDRGDSQSEN